MKSRNYGIDLLRIVSMFMICILHVIGVGGVLEASATLSLNYNIVWLIECACNCAVNAFALISGYVGIEKKFKIFNIISLWIIVEFYSVGITMVICFLTSCSIGIKDIIKSVIPVTSGGYWYFTAYFAMFFLTPLLNAAIQNVDRLIYKCSILFSAFIFCVMGTLSLGMDTFGLRFGYTTWWLIYLYTIGGYLRKYGSRVIGHNCKIWFELYLGSTIISWLAKMVMTVINTFLGKELLPTGILISYTSPTMLLSGIGLTMLFANLKIESAKTIKIIKVISPLAFSVYIIHCHPLIYRLALTKRFEEYAKFNVLGMFVLIILTATIIFMACILVDIIRKSLFKRIGLIFTELETMKKQ